MERRRFHRRTQPRPFQTINILDILKRILLAVFATATTLAVHHAPEPTPLWFRVVAFLLVPLLLTGAVAFLPPTPCSTPVWRPR
jgi:hypothetical protein